MTVFPFGLPLIWDHSFSNITESSYFEFLQKTFWERCLVDQILLLIFSFFPIPLNHISPANTNFMSTLIMKEGTKGKQRTGVLCTLLPLVVLVVVWILRLAGIGIHFLSGYVSASFFPLPPFFCSLSLLLSLAMGNYLLFVPLATT